MATAMMEDTIPPDSHITAWYISNPRSTLIAVYVKAKSEVDVHVVTRTESNGFLHIGETNFDTGPRTALGSQSHRIVTPWPARHPIVLIIVNRTEKHVHVEYDVGILAH
jgi:hypothetical protein